MRRATPTAGTPDELPDGPLDGPPDGDLPTLAVAIATLGPRVLGVRPEALTPVDGVSYHVFLQMPPDAGPGAGPGAGDVRAHLDRLGSRGDVVVHRLDGAGLARSRNAALERVRADLLLVADDDVEFRPGSFRGLRRAFAAEPGLDFACGRLHAPDGLPLKRYDPPGRRARFWNCGKVQSPEIALRLAPVRAAGLRFDEEFGLGTRNRMGEEYIFLVDALRAGLRGRHLALVLGVHPRLSSGLDPSPAATAIRGAVFRRALGPLSGPLFALFRLRRALRRAPPGEGGA